MSDFVLVIGDKNLSSWSLRPWLALKHAGVPFTERLVRLDRPTSRAELAAASPSGLVPCLIHDDFSIWDSLAICEYVAEIFPEAGLWPADRKARAHARAVSAEMHSGFAALRRAWPMNFARRNLARAPSPEVTADIARIAAIWTEARERFGRNGPFLYGGFSIADAMYAPVASRFATYGPVDLPPPARDYAQTLFELPAMSEWGEAAAAEVSEG